MKPGSRVRILTGPDKDREATVLGLAVQIDGSERMSFARPQDVDPIIEFTPEDSRVSSWLRKAMGKR